MLDAYCLHMKAHLAKSTSTHSVQTGANVEGDSIRCPYHGWKYGADGSLEEIPYEKDFSLDRFSIGSYPIREVMGCVLMWHDPEGLAPDSEPPYLPAWDAPEAIHWQLVQRQGGFIDFYQAHLQTVTWYTGPGILLSKQAYKETVRYEFIPALQVIQTPHDGRFRAVRKWVKQFYMPREEAAVLQAELNGVLTVPGFPDAEPYKQGDFEADCFACAPSG